MGLKSLLHNLAIYFMIMRIKHLFKDEELEINSLKNAIVYITSLCDREKTNTFKLGNYNVFTYNGIMLNPPNSVDKEHIKNVKSHIEEILSPYIHNTPDTTIEVEPFFKDGEVVKELLHLVLFVYLNSSHN